MVLAGRLIEPGSEQDCALELLKICKQLDRIRSHASDAIRASQRDRQARFQGMRGAP